VDEKSAEKKTPVSKFFKIRVLRGRMGRREYTICIYLEI